MTRDADGPTVVAMNIHDQLVADIEAFLLKHGMSKTELGIHALSNKHTVRRLHEGMGISSHRIAALYNFMRAYETGNGRRRKANHSSIQAA